MMAHRAQAPEWTQHDGLDAAAAGAITGTRWLRIQARWRWLVRRWAFALAGLAVGLAGGWGLALDHWREHGRAVQALQDMRQQLAALPQTRAVPAAVEPAELARLPLTGQPAATWLALQQVLAGHGVRVLSLRPLDERRLSPLPSQAVALRLQSRFGDWVAAWTSLSRAGPVWAIERLRIAPVAATEALAMEVEMEVVLRIWMREGVANSEAEVAWVQAASAPRQPVREVVVFASTSSVRPEAKGGDAPGGGDKRAAQQVHAPSDSVSALAPSAASTAMLPPAGAPAKVQPLVLAPLPEHLPAAPWRLLGIWEHSGQAQAFLASATHWFAVRAGQTISREGDHLETVDADRVTWRDPQGQRHTLTLESRSP